MDAEMQPNHPVVSNEELKAIPAEIIALVDKNTAVRFRAIPVRLEGDDLMVAVEKPEDPTSYDGVSYAAQKMLLFCKATSDQIDRALEKHYGVSPFNFAEETFGGQRK